MEKNTKQILLATGAGLIAAGIISKVFLRPDNYQLNGKVVLITGGSRGLGLVMARQLLHEGAKVVICGRNIEELEKAKMQLLEISQQIMTVPCDLTEKDQIVSLFDKIRSQWGKVDCLINNAGVIQVGPVETMEVEDFEKAMKIHFWAPLFTMLQVLPEMMKKEEGRIVNISSIGGKISFPHLLPYNASKFALTGLSEGMSVEMRNYGIKITTVCPGLMQTGSPLNADFKSQHKKEFSWFSIADSMPLLSMNAEKAASKIIMAMKRGDSSLNLGLPAKLAIAINGIAPGFVSDTFSAINQLLPAKGGIGSKTAKGRESESSWTKSFLTKNTRNAANKNNE